MSVPSPVSTATTADVEFVFVHGTWGGAWQFEELCNILKARGVAASAVTLTGCGDRAHLFTEQIDLHTHVQDVIAHIRYRQLMRRPAVASSAASGGARSAGKVVLVGNSYAGMVCRQLVHSWREAVEHIELIVYFDAIVPRHGQNVFDLNPAHFKQSVMQTLVDGNKVAVGVVPLEKLGVTEPEHVALATTALTTHPFATYLTRVRLHAGAGWQREIAVRSCVVDTTAWFPDTNKLAKELSWPIHVWNCGSHLAFFTHAAETADHLLQLLSSPASSAPGPGEATAAAAAAADDANKCRRPIAAKAPCARQGSIEATGSSPRRRPSAQA